MPSCKLAVIKEDGLGCGMYRTWPVCSKPAGNTKEGLCDMSGNLWEWIADVYEEDYYKQSPRKNPLGPSPPPGKDDKDIQRIDRGGSFFNFRKELRITWRDKYWINKPGPSVGIRCVR